jgi:hypothetical protein
MTTVKPVCPTCGHALGGSSDETAQRMALPVWSGDFVEILPGAHHVGLGKFVVQLPSGLPRDAAATYRVDYVDPIGKRALVSIDSSLQWFPFDAIRRCD